MATTPTPAEIASGSACYHGLSAKLDAIIYLLNTTMLTPDQIQDGAKCYSGLSDKWGCMIYLLALNGGGGGGGGSSGVIQGHYGGGAPSASAASYGVAGDLDTGQIWFSDGTTWTQYA